jgi:hypothetical protein
MDTFQRLLIVGAGGTGSILAPLAARYCTFAINDKVEVIIADGDTYESHNATRQPVGPGAVGRNKAAVLAEQLQQQGLPCRAHEDFINRSNIHSLITYGTIVLAAVDNHQSRRMMLERIDELVAAGSGPILWISPANSSGTSLDKVRGNTLWYGSWATGHRPGQGPGQGPVPSGPVGAVQGSDLGGPERSGRAAAPASPQAESVSHIEAPLARCGMDAREAVKNIAEARGEIPRKGSCALLAPGEPQLLVANVHAAAWALTVLAAVWEERMPREMSSVNWSLEGVVYS